METTVETMIGGRYELLQHFARGGHSDVFFARDHKDGSTVAVKRLRHSDDHFRALLLREARILSRLVQHTRVVTFRDVVQEHGTVYLVTEFVYGETIDRWQWLWKPSQEEILRVYTRIASVLHEIHEAGFMHCDLTPGNVMVVEKDGGDEVKLMGFQLSVETQEPDLLTGEGMVLGTPVYTPPEMIKGEKMTTAADVYSLGLMLLQAITGRLPWDRSIDGLAARLIPLPDLGELDDCELGTLIKCMLAIEPEARPSAHAVAERCAIMADALLSSS